MGSNLEWFVVPRPAIAGVLVGVERPERLIAPPQDPSAATKEELFVACRRGLDPGELVPALVVMPDDVANDHLSWLASFSPETFPITQYARVLPWDDFNASQSSLGDAKTLAVNTVWSSIVLGEMLGQGESDSDLSSIPLSRAQACFSHAMGRVHVLHGEHSSLIDHCAKRLAQIGSDRSFVTRSIGAAELGPIWALAPGRIDDTIPPMQVVRQVADVWAQGIGRGSPSGRANPQNLFEDVPFERLSSGPVEQRVREYERFSALLSVRSDGDSTRSTLASFLLACGAFLVGNGTSHIGLLGAMAARHRLVYPWFGLFAGMAGPRNWDSNWLTTVKGVERQLRLGTTLYDPPSFDLCWVEYKWMLEMQRTGSFLKRLHKLLPHALSIEVVPGAPCQLRLSKEAGGETEVGKAESRARHTTDALSRGLEGAVAQLEQAISQLKRLAADSKQGALFESQGSSPNRGRYRRPYPSGGSDSEGG